MWSFRIIRGLLIAIAGMTVGAPAVSAQWPATRLLRFELDDKAKAIDLLPTPPEFARPTGPVGDDLSHVPEVHFQAPFDSLANDARDPRIQIGLQIARINLLNQRKRDLFLKTLLEHRPDLAGLPFVMGDASRLPEFEKGNFKNGVSLVRGCLDDSSWGSKGGVEKFWQLYDERLATKLEDEAFLPAHRFVIGGLIQMVEPESSYHTKLVVRLADFARPEATEGLARLAVFSPDKETRQAALNALKKRDSAPATKILLKGLRYPWSSIAQNTAEAIVQLKRSDLVPELVKLLEEPDPRAPVKREVNGKTVPFVRELVRINHPRNCLLCHPPGNTKDVFQVSEAVEGPNSQPPLKGVRWSEVEKGVWNGTTHYPKFDPEIVFGAVPIPGERFPSKSYGQFHTDILVRADVTFLRHDFSLLHKVEDANPWPAMQRFDYVVRSRTLTEDEAKTYRKAFADDAAFSPYQKMAQDALRRLAGKNAKWTAAEWRNALISHLRHGAG